MACLRDHNNEGLPYQRCFNAVSLTRISSMTQLSDLGRLSRSTSLVTLIVGQKPDQETFVCHKGLLGFCSDFFDAAFNGEFIEAQKSEIEMPTDNPIIVKMFISWIYSGWLPPSSEAVSLLALWVFGDKVLSPRFCNYIMLHLFSYYGHGGGNALRAHDAIYVMERTTLKSKLREFIMETSHDRSPFNKRDEDLKDHQRDWEKAVKNGGDIMVEFAKSGTFLTKDDCDCLCMSCETKTPAWHSENHHMYLIAEPAEKKAKDWKIWEGRSNIKKFTNMGAIMVDPERRRSKRQRISAQTVTSLSLARPQSKDL